MKKILMMAAVCLMAAMTFAAQCAATTKKGTQCKREASPGSQYCWQHGGSTKAERAANGESEAPKRSPRRAERRESGEQPGDAPAAKPVRRKTQREEAPAANDAPAPVEGQCQATTKRGTQCRRKAVEGGKYCAQHAAKKDGGEASGAAAERPKRARRQKEETSAETAADVKPERPKRARRQKEETSAETAADVKPERPKRARKPKAEAAAEPVAKPAEAEASGGMCQGKSKNGEPCKRKAKPGSKFCWQHGG